MNQLPTLSPAVHLLGLQPADVIMQAPTFIVRPARLLRSRLLCGAGGGLGGPGLRGGLLGLAAAGGSGALGGRQPVGLRAQLPAQSRLLHRGQALLA
jgi:hypothetical protein